MLVQAYRGDEVASGPEMLACNCKVALAFAEPPCNLDGALALEIPDHIGYRVLRWNAQTHMDVIAHHVSFDDLRLIPCAPPTREISPQAADAALRRFVSSAASV